MNYSVYSLCQIICTYICILTTRKLYFNIFLVDVLFDMDPDGRLQTMMDTAYKETSTRVVEVLTKQYHLMEHLHAIKGYLLLGQGNFIQYLMHLLE